MDLPGLERNLGSLTAYDLSAFLVLGSSGEAGSLDEGEKLAVIEAARRALGGRALLAGTGLEGTRATISLTRKAADRGVDGILVLTPHYYRSRMSDEALRRHYEAVADASPVPLYLYSVPAFTGLSWPAGLAGALAAHPRVAGIKESSGDVALLARIVTEVPRSFEVSCGNAAAFYPSLCVGATGGVLAVTNCVPDVVIALFQAFRAGDHERARLLQAGLLPLAAALGTRFGVAGLKAAMDATGLCGGSVRSPLLAVDGPARQEIAGLVARARSALR